MLVMEYYFVPNYCVLVVITYIKLFRDRTHAESRKVGNFPWPAYKKTTWTRTGTSNEVSGHIKNSRLIYKLIIYACVLKYCVYLEFTLQLLWVVRTVELLINPRPCYKIAKSCNLKNENHTYIYQIIFSL